MPSASPSATATIMTSSSSEPDAEERFVFTLLGVVGSLGLAGLGLLGSRRRRLDGFGGLDRFGVLLERLLVDRVAGHLLVGRRRGGRLGLCRGIVQQTRL